MIIDTKFNIGDEIFLVDKFFERVEIAKIIKCNVTIHPDNSLVEEYIAAPVCKHVASSGAVRICSYKTTYIINKIINKEKAITTQTIYKTFFLDYNEAQKYAIHNGYDFITHNNINYL